MENCKYRITERVNLSNEKSTGPREMITVLSQPDKIKDYLDEKNAKRNTITAERKNEKYDFSDLGIGRD